MTKHFSTAILLTFVVAADVFSEDRFPLRARRILFLGDSITNAGHYIADIETQLRLQGRENLPELINLGLPSETCTGLSEPDHPFPRPDVQERIDRALQKVKPDVVVACYGMNDGIYYPFSEGRFEKYQAGITKIAKKAHDAGAKVVFITPPPFDPLPLRNKPGRLLPLGAEKYSWTAIYEDYDQVIKRYSDWIRQQGQQVDMIIDVHTPLTEFLIEQRKNSPEFHVASDGVHMNEIGHRVMAKAILKAWGVESREQPTDDLRSTVKQKESILHSAWVSHIGHKRPGVKAGLPLSEATAKAKSMQTGIDRMVKAEAK